MYPKEELFPENGDPIVISYGGGKNSTAMVLALWLSKIPVSAVLFADTGNEHPDTYTFLDYFDRWLLDRGLPAITRIQFQLKGTHPRPRKKVAIKVPYRWLASDLGCYLLAFHFFRQNYKYRSLGEECLTLGALPSKAYGHGKCSAKWKVQVQQNWIKKVYPNTKVRVCVGIHAGEQNRLLNKDGSPKPLVTELGRDCYPLIRWGMGEQGCVALNRKFLERPPAKSACWFCPNASPSEVKALKHDRPDLYKLGVEMEALAQSNGARKGLGRSFHWSEVDNMDEYKQLSLDLSQTTRKCGCLD